MLSCENSEVMEENSKEGKLVEAKEEEGCKERGNHLLDMNLQLMTLTLQIYLYVMKLLKPLPLHLSACEHFATR